jgi:hypothetical protein
MLGFLGCKSTPQAPARPSLVPQTAVWAGGVDGGSFIECDVDSTNDVNRCLAYNEYTGNVEGGGFFQLSGLKRAAHQDELHYRGFDGDRIYLTTGVLEPVKPIKPDAVPNDSTFANGLFIRCGNQVSDRVQCAIYRPDGSQYFYGSFVSDVKLGGKVTDGYKFFELSNRTINLESGGALVAK